MRISLQLLDYENVIFQLPGPVRVNAHHTLANVFQPPCCCSMSFESSAEDAQFIKHPLKDVCAVQLLPGYYNHPLGRLNSPAELCAPGPHLTGTLQSFTITCCSAKSLLSCSCPHQEQPVISIIFTVKGVAGVLITKTHRKYFLHTLTFRESFALNLLTDSVIFIVITFSFCFGL